MSEIHGFELCDPLLGTQLHTTSEDKGTVDTPSMTVTLAVHQKQQFLVRFC